MAAFGLLGLLFAFYPGLFWVKAAPLTGDHLEQHYPWAYLLAQSLQEFKLPFWTPLIHCGFPLIAESQIGAFYIPNLLMYFFLPFHTAYSYMNLVHWFIAGWGTYLYAKQMNLSPMAAFVAAVIFTFGSAYGGAYYNMTSLKTICWFPVALYFLEQYLCKRVWLYLVGMAVIVSQSFVAGYLQMATLTWLVFGIYAVLRVIAFSNEPSTVREKSMILGTLLLAACGAILLTMPQLLLSYPLAMLSNRSGLAEGYAYVGSMSPMVLGTLINPSMSLIFRGNNLYAGLFSVFLVFFAIFSKDVRKNTVFRIWSVMAVIAFFLALGQWSPLYVAIIKLTHFYSFRIPAKFLGFVCFGLAMLGASGFQALWQGRFDQSALKKAFRSLISVLAFFTFFMVMANWFLTAGRNIAFRIGEFFVKHFVYAKPGHPHSLEDYLSVVRNYPDNALRYLSLDNPANIWVVVMAVLCSALIWSFLKKKNVSRYLLGAGIALLVVDLFVASFLDIKLDLSSYQKALETPPVVQALLQEKEAGRVNRIYGFRAPTQRLPLVPSKNMLYGIEDIGIYTPFVMTRYYETIGLFGNVNDSNLAVTPTPAFVRLHLPLLSFLNVSHVLSAAPLSHPDLKLLYSDPAGKSFLYRNERAYASAYFLRNVKFFAVWDDLKRDLMANDFDPAQQLLLERSEIGENTKMLQNLTAGPASPESVVALRARSDTQQVWDIVVPANGFFVIPKTAYPGWKAWVDGKEAPILKAYGIFQAVYIEAAGNHSIRFEFQPMESLRRS